jgi:shikimate kinase
VDVRHIVVLGLMGAGKTAVGQVLARRLGWHLSDSDEEIRARTGKTVRELRAEKGVDAMHRLEYEHLLTALEVDQTTIVCGAASVVEDAGCRAAMTQPGVVTVLLEATPATLAKRFLSGGHRPAYGDDPETFLSEQQVLREPLFRAVCQILIDVDQMSVEAVAAAILTETRCAPTEAAPRPN